MGFGETLVSIIAIISIASVLQAAFNGRHRRGERVMEQMARMRPPPDPEAGQLREEVRGLKERVAVLERLITDQSTSLDREFEKLKTMD